MLSVHDQLSEKFKAYALWHQNPRRSRHHFILFLIVAVGITFGMIDNTYEPLPQYASTNMSRPYDSVRTLTNQMLSTIEAYALAPREGREQLLSIVLPIIEARNEAFRALARRHPERAALEALPQQLIESLPREIAHLLEGDLNLLSSATPDQPTNSSAAAAALAAGGCIPGATEATFSPASQIAHETGEALVYTLTIANTDNAGCPSSTYTVTMTPAAWISSSTPILITVLPSATSSAEVVVSSPTTQPTGITTITAQVRGGGGSHDTQARATYITYPDHTAPNTPEVQAFPGEE